MIGGGYDRGVLEATFLVLLIAASLAIRPYTRRRETPPSGKIRKRTCVKARCSASGPRR